MVGMMLALALACCLSQDPDKLQAVEELGLRVAPGFKVTLFADHTLANDIYAMTLDSKGRVVVTSQGWIKILEDTNHDGVRQPWETDPRRPDTDCVSSTTMLRAWGLAAAIIAFSGRPYVRSGAMVSTKFGSSPS